MNRTPGNIVAKTEAHIVFFGILAAISMIFSVTVTTAYATTTPETTEDSITVTPEETLPTDVPEETVPEEIPLKDEPKGQNEEPTEPVLDEENVLEASALSSFSALVVVPEPITIIAHKIVCDTESDLPNWGDGGPSISPSTATDFVAANSPSCRFESGWNFQWGYGPKSGSTGVTDPGASLIGPAPTGSSYDSWKDFPSATDGSGKTELTISDLEGSTRIWVRLAQKSGYTPFSEPTIKPVGQKDAFSAELYCHEDVLNYDNFDYVINPTAGNTYHCISFDVQKVTTPPGEPKPTNACTLPSAPGRTILNFDSSKGKIRSDKPESENEHFRKMHAFLLKGTYAVTLQSFDGYQGRAAGTPQTEEAWFAMLLDKYGNEIVRTAATTDLADNADDVLETYQVETDLVLSTQSVEIVASHAAGFGKSGQINSLYPVCAAFDIKTNNGGGSSTSTPTIMITLLGDNPTNLTVGDTFIDPGVTATTSDNSAFTIASSTDPISGVDTSVAGTYTITYTATSGTAGTATTTRTVIVSNPTNTGGNGGGSGGGGNGSGTGSSSSGSSSSFTGSSFRTTSSPLSNSCTLLNEYLRFGYDNNPTEVVKLQSFLNTSEGASIAVTGFFDETTLNAVNNFQAKYLSEVMGPWDATRPSGYVYITTQKKINEIACNIAFVISPSEQAIIDAYIANQNAQEAGIIDPSNPLSPSGEPIGLELELGTSTDDDSNIAGAAGSSIASRLWDFIRNLFRR